MNNPGIYLLPSPTIFHPIHKIVYLSTRKTNVNIFAACTS
jgi:hypothetical protein